MKYWNRIPEPGTIISGFDELPLVKRQKWLSEFCVKIHRVASKN
jgi:hypothetical protein